MRFVRTRRIAIWLAAFLVFFTVVGFFVLPPIVKSLLTTKLSRALERQVTIERVTVNPYSLTVGLRGVTIKERAGKDVFFRFDNLAVALDPSSLIRRSLLVRRVILAKPYVHVVRDSQGAYNFSDLLAPGPKEDKDKEKSFRFSVSNIQLRDGSIDFVDGPKKSSHTVRRMDLDIPFLSNVPHQTDIFVQPRFSAEIDGSSYALEGRTKPFRQTRESDIAFHIKGLDIARYIQYIPIRTTVVLVSALLDLDGNIAFMQGENQHLAISARAALSGIALDDLRKRPLLRLPSAVFAVSSLEPFRRKVHISEISFTSPSLIVRRAADGSLDPGSLLVPTVETADRTGGTAKSEEAETRKASPFAITMDRLSLEGGAVTFEDGTFTPSLVVQAKNMAATASDVSTEGPGKVSFSCDIFRKGSIGATGSLALDPLSLDLTLAVKKVFLSPLQPYFQDRVRLAVTGGNLSGTGKLVVKAGGTGPLALTYRGDAFLSSFSSIDREGGDPLLAWKNMAFTKIDFALHPFNLQVNGVSLTDFYSRIVVNADGSTNLHEAMAGKGQDASSPTPSGRTSPVPANQPIEPPGNEAGDIQIKSITLQGGRIDFTDRRVEPSYQTELSELSGRISQLSFKKGGTAQIEVLGNIAKYIPLRIAGTINPAPGKLFIDLTASFHDLDISPMTPYSSRYAGYTIEKGKLSLDVKYLVNNRRLESQNLIFLDQFTFGERVESPQATDLPVRLAVALLKDRNGRIKLDIPVSGSIDDPKFRVGRIIWQVIVNLVTRAATSPFALLGSLFGGGEELGYVEFDYGASRLGEPGMKKLETLAKALSERPSLKLDIEGHVDVEQDREAYRRYLLLKKVKAEKLKDMLKQRQRPAAVDDIEIPADEYDTYLTKAYRAEKFPKPRNAIGLTKTIPRAEMEKLMLTNSAVKDEDLRNLAIQRAMKVSEALLKTGGVPAERIFVTEPKSLAPEERQNVKSSRVDFRLK